MTPQNRNSQAVTPTEPTIPQGSQVLHEQLRAIEGALANTVTVIQKAIGALQAAEPKAEPVAVVGDTRVTLEKTAAGLLEDMLSCSGDTIPATLEYIRSWIHDGYLEEVALDVALSDVRWYLADAKVRKLFHSAREGDETARAELLSELRRRTNAVIDGRPNPGALAARRTKHAPRFAESIGVTTEELLSVVPSLDLE